LEELLSASLRILFVSQLFDPENAIKGAAFAQQLQALGHEVEVVTTFPSYPGGRVFAGYRQQWRAVEKMGGVRVVRVPSFISHGQSAVKRMLSYASFAVSAGVYCLFSARKPDVLYAYYPPVMVGLMALVLGWIRRVPYVYDVQDLWPEALIGTGHLRPESRLFNWIERACGWVYSRSALVTVLSQGYRQILIAKGVPAEKVVCVYNWCDESRMQVVDGQPVNWGSVPGSFRVLYAGNLGSAQALSHVIDAASLLQKSGDQHIQIVLLGGGVQRDELCIKAQGLTNVTFLPPVPVDEVGAYLQAADVLLVHLADAPVFDITIPQKTQAYLQAGKPILMAVRGEAADLVASAGAGIVVPPENAVALAAAVSLLAQKSPAQLVEMGQRGAQFYRQNMSMDQGVRAVESLLMQAVSK
jgi:glycosyltransferase involved in cell wall biosynthesis